MTRDELRAKCIEAIMLAIGCPIGDATAALDALHGIARVCPVGVEGIRGVWEEMPTIGDLTNPPEGGP